MAVDENGSVSWIDTDALGVYAAHTENAKFTSTGSGASVSFTGNLSPSDETVEWAYYPYDTDAVLNNRALSFTLPSEYTYTGNSNAPMLGIKGTDGNFEFKHLCGLLRITLGGGMPADAGRFVITSVGDDAPAIAGMVTVADVAISDAILAMETENGSHSITYHLDGLTVAEEFQHFFVPLPVGKYVSLQVSFYLKGKEEAEFTRAISNLEVRRAVMTSLPVLDWKTGAQFVLSENTKEITAELAKKISMSETDNTMLTYRDVPEDEMPKEGEVVWTKVQEGFPYGFLGKVVSVTKQSDNSCSIVTEPVALSEAFDELYIDEEVGLVAEALPRSSATGTGGLNLAKQLSLEIQDKEKPYGMSATLDVGASLQMTVVIDKKKKVEQLSVTFVPEFAVSGKVFLAGEFNKEGEIGDFPLPDINCGVILLGGGLIPLVPAVQLHGYLVPHGKITMETSVDYGAKASAGVEFKDNVWRADANPMGADELTLDLLSSKIALQGDLFYGFGVELKGKFYNSNKMKMYALTKVGIQFEAEIEVSSKDTESLEDKFKDLSIHSKKLLVASVGMDATLVSEEAEKEYELPEIYWDKREHTVLPAFEKLSSKIAQMTQPLAVATRVTEGEDSYEAVLETKATGNLMSKDVQLFIELKNEQGEVIASSEPVDYMEAYSESLPLSAKFSGLNSNTEYTAYVVMQSRMFSDVVADKRVDLESVATTFTVGTSLREQLIQLYKDAGGDNWTRKENWLTEEPIEKWAGVHREEDGKYTILLYDNNLTGNFNLSDASIKCISLDNNQLEEINVSGCTSLAQFMIQGNPLTSLDISGCGFSQVHDIHGFDETNLKTLKANGCPNLTALHLSSGEVLETIEASGCPNLNSLMFYSRETFRNLNISQCPLLEELYCLNGVKNIEVLNVSGCTKLTSIHLAESIKELYAKDCTELKTIGITKEHPNLKVLETAGCPKLKELVCGESLLTSLDLTGCSGLESLYCEEAQLKTLILKGCSNLTFLNCQGNQLTALDISDSSNLISLNCQSNKIEKLDVAHCIYLEDLSCAGGNNISELNLSNCKKLKSLSCSGNPLEILDVSQNRELELLACGMCRLSKLDITNNEKLTALWCDQNTLSLLDISKCTKLTQLDCSLNNLETLDVSKCTDLQDLNLDGTSLTALDVSNCSSLYRLSANKGKLKELKLNPNSSLKYISLDANEFVSFNISGMSEVAWVSLRENRYLEMVDISGCSLESIDFLGSEKLKTLHADNCTNLRSLGDLSNTGLSELTLTNCTKLEKLNCWGNKLKSLDISTCTNLVSLDCFNNPELSDFKLMSSGKLTYVDCSGTKITMEIPSWFPEKFFYEQRYTNYHQVQVGNTYKWEYDDKGYGWWYPGEPDSGRHGR